MRGSDSGSILVVVCILLFLVLTLTMVLADQSLKDQSRRDGNGTLLKDVYEAVVGIPVDGKFGYLGDVGDYPASLADLLNDPGLTGWNGPYVHNAPVANGMVYDWYGSPLEFYFNLVNGSLDQITVIGRGRDHSSDNTAANPNVDSQFTGTLPGAGGYAAATGNSDNELYPDFVTTANSLSREAVGTLTYNIQNFDQHPSSGAIVAGCPGLYSMNITSVPRGAADRTTVTYPSTLYAQTLQAQLLQGMYDVEITSQGALGSVWRDRLAILPDVTLSKSLIAPRIDSSTTPSTGYSLTIYNNSGGTVTARAWGVAIGAGLQVTTAEGIETGTVRPCSLITVRSGVGAGGTLYDTFIMPYGNFTRVVKAPPQTTYTLTVTNGGTNSDVIKVIHAGHPGFAGMRMTLGTVYKRKTRVFTIPGTINTNIPVGNRGVLIEYRRRDDTLISSATYTASPAPVTVP